MLPRAVLLALLSAAAAAAAAGEAAVTLRPGAAGVATARVGDLVVLDASGSPGAGSPGARWVVWADGQAAAREHILGGASPFPVEGHARLELRPSFPALYSFGWVASGRYTSGTAEVNVTGAVNRPPSGVLAGGYDDRTAAPGDEVLLDASPSTDPEGDALRVEWRVVRALPRVPLPPHEFLTPPLEVLRPGGVVASWRPPAPGLYAGFGAVLDGHWSASGPNHGKLGFGVLVRVRDPAAPLPRPVAEVLPASHRVRPNTTLELRAGAATEAPANATHRWVVGLVVGSGPAPGVPADSWTSRLDGRAVSWVHRLGVVVEAQAWGYMQNGARMPGMRGPLEGARARFVPDREATYLVQLCVDDGLGPVLHPREGEDPVFACAPPVYVEVSASA